MGMVAVGRGGVCVMCDAGRAVRVDHRVVYAWNCRRVARTQVWHVLIVIVVQNVQREYWVLVIDLHFLQNKAAV